MPNVLFFSFQFIIFEEQSLVRQQQTRDNGGDGDDSVEEGDEGSVVKSGGSETDTGQVVLTLEHLQGPFLVLFFGCLAGGIVLVIELFIMLTVLKPQRN